MMVQGYSRCNPIHMYLEPVVGKAGGVGNVPQTTHPGVGDGHANRAPAEWRCVLCLAVDWRSYPTPPALNNCKWWPWKHFGSGTLM